MGFVNSEPVGFTNSPVNKEGLHRRVQALSCLLFQNHLLTFPDCKIQECSVRQFEAKVFSTSAPGAAAIG